MGHAYRRHHDAPNELAFLFFRGEQHGWTSCRLDGGVVRLVRKNAGGGVGALRKSERPFLLAGTIWSSVENRLAGLYQTSIGPFGTGMCSRWATAGSCMNEATRGGGAKRGFKLPSSYRN